ncbi:MAG: 2-amino-4-oxopentanoate thiolase subunit OrtA [Eubacteriales bacterium]|nr:2-amino-4-oxopentanoate thiolase subunit OrtA [Eubacteriales bacterium]
MANQEPHRLYKAGDLVTIEQVSLPAGERAGSVPEDTAQTPLLLWVKGELQKDAYTGEEVEVKTEIGRLVTGRLTNHPVNYQHNFGEAVAELAEVRKLVKAVLWEEV